MINAILWKLRTGAPWRNLPERYGPWKTAHERLRRWTADSTWDRILAEAITKDDAIGAVEWTISIDSSHIRAHQHAAGARKKRLRQRMLPVTVNGCPRSRPDQVIADKTCSHPSTRAALRRRGVTFTNPERADQITQRRNNGPRGGRPPGFDHTAYTGHNIVERCFNRLKQFRGLATRYATHAAYYQAESPSPPPSSGSATT